jgi:hypothetical protein
LRWRPREALTPAEVAALAAHKGELLTLLAGPTEPALEPGCCPSCHRPLDARGRCWRCCDRTCERCGRPTGSAFIATCCPCGNALDGNSGDRVPGTEPVSREAVPSRPWVFLLGKGRS